MSVPRLAGSDLEGAVFDSSAFATTFVLDRRNGEMQRPDGGWDASAFYNVMGSDELTTGLCLEVLGTAVRSAAS